MILRAVTVFCLVTGLLAPDVMALSVKTEGPSPCGHQMCICCHGESRDGGMVCPRNTSRESSTMKACEDDTKAGSSPSVYLFETPMVLESQVALVPSWIPSNCRIRPWVSIPDFPPPRS